MTTILQQSSANADHDYLLLLPNGLCQFGQPLGALCPHGLAQRQGHSLQQRFHFDAFFDNYIARDCPKPLRSVIFSDMPTVGPVQTYQWS